MKDDDLEALKGAIKLLREAQDLCSQAGAAFSRIMPPDADEDPSGIHPETKYMIGFVYQEVDQLAGALHMYGELFGPDQSDLFEKQESQVITSGNPN